MSGPAVRPEDELGFWPNYREPTALAKAIQMPLHPADRWMTGVLNAHIKRPTLTRNLSEDKAR